MAAKGQIGVSITASVLGHTDQLSTEARALRCGVVEAPGWLAVLIAATGCISVFL
jgi:hypothetical protein